MNCAHGVGVAFQVGVELEDGAARLAAEHAETDEPSDRRRGNAAVEDGATARCQIERLGRGSQCVAHRNSL